MTGAKTSAQDWRREHGNTSSGDNLDVIADSKQHSSFVHSHRLKRRLRFQSEFGWANLGGKWAANARRADCSAATERSDW